HRGQQSVVKAAHLVLLRKRCVTLGEEEASSEKQSKAKAGESAHVDLLAPPSIGSDIRPSPTCSTFLLAPYRQSAAAIGDDFGQMRLLEQIGRCLAATITKWTCTYLTPLVPTTA